jgi:hypothetical protein
MSLDFASFDASWVKVAKNLLIEFPELHQQKKLSIFYFVYFLSFLSVVDISVFTSISVPHDAFGWKSFHPTSIEHDIYLKEEINMKMIMNGS